MKKFNYLITGGAGFIGTNIVHYLKNHANKIIIVDNLSTGKLKNVPNQENIKFYKIDLNNNLPDKIFKNIDCIIHLAANADIKDGFKNTKKDIYQNILATENLLKKAVKFNIKDFIFSSTAAVYGEPKDYPTKEITAMPIQTSLYGMSKLAAEGIFSSFTFNYGLRTSILRFVSILGDHYSHGHIIDFYKKILNNKKKLLILGNGFQKKSYLHVNDLVKAFDLLLKKKHFSKKSFFEIYNIGNNNFCTVNKSALIISKAMSAKPKFFYSGGRSGWQGDSPFVFLDINKISKLGWKPESNILIAIKKTIQWLINEKNTN